MSKRIVISGYYGFRNAGDEAVLAGMLATFRQVGLDARVTVLSADPVGTRAQHPGVDAVHRYRIGPVVQAIRRADLVISGGGSLLQDVTSARSARYYLFILQLAQFLRKKTAIYAQGIGPLNNTGTRSAVGRTLNKTSLVSVRDEQSRNLLVSIGVNRQPIHVVADPSFVVEPDIEAADNALAGIGLGGKELIGVSLRPWPLVSGWLEKAAEGIAQACEELGVAAVLIPMQEPEDAVVCGSVAKGVMLREIGGVRAIKGLIARCDLVVGMRLHSLIFAASEGVPFVPIVYDPKVSAFASMAGMEDGVDVESLTAETMRNAVRLAWAQRASLGEQLKQRVADLRQLALEPGELVRTLLE